MPRLRPRLSLNISRSMRRNHHLTGRRLPDRFQFPLPNPQRLQLHAHLRIVHQLPQYRHRLRRRHLLRLSQGVPHAKTHAKMSSNMNVHKKKKDGSKG